MLIEKSNNPPGQAEGAFPLFGAHLGREDSSLWIPQVQDHHRARILFWIRAKDFVFPIIRLRQRLAGSLASTHVWTGDGDVWHLSKFHF
jgi:hypothetical protein